MRCAAAIAAGAGLRAAAHAAASAVNVEYVSANPTGPMHVGHCRGAVFGDALANLLDFAGHKVTREYYINDAGAQVDVLARSAYLRYREALGEDIGAIPEGLYPGDYLKPVGEALAAEHGRTLNAEAGGATGCRSCAQRAIDMMMAMIREDLAALNVATTCSSPSARCRRRQRDQVARDDRAAARSKGTSTRAACRRRRARRSRTGRIASRRCSARPRSATTSTGR